MVNILSKKTYVDKTSVIAEIGATLTKHEGCFYCGGSPSYKFISMRLDKIVVCCEKCYGSSYKKEKLLESHDLGDDKRDFDGVNEILMVRM